MNSKNTIHRTQVKHLASSSVSCKYYPWLNDVHFNMRLNWLKTVKTYFFTSFFIFSSSSLFGKGFKLCTRVQDSYKDELTFSYSYMNNNNNLNR